MGRQRQQPQGPLLLHHPRRPQTARRRNQELVAHRRHDGPPSGERIMIALRVLLSRLLGRGRTHAELDSEIAAHLSLLAADYQRRGLSPAHALAAPRPSGAEAPPTPNSPPKSPPPSRSSPPTPTAAASLPPMPSPPPAATSAPSPSSTKPIATSAASPSSTPSPRTSPTPFANSAAIPGSPPPPSSPSPSASAPMPPSTRCSTPSSSAPSPCATPPRWCRFSCSKTVSPSTSATPSIANWPPASRRSADCRSEERRGGEERRSARSPFH